MRSLILLMRVHMRSFSGVSNPLKQSALLFGGKVSAWIRVCRCGSAGSVLWRPLSCCPYRAIINGITGMQGWVPKARAELWFRNGDSTQKFRGKINHRTADWLLSGTGLQCSWVQPNNSALNNDRVPQNNCFDNCRDFYLTVATCDVLQLCLYSKLNTVK